MINKIRELDMNVGVAFNPHTEIPGYFYDNIIDKIDMVLIMSV